MHSDAGIKTLGRKKLWRPENVSALAPTRAPREHVGGMHEHGLAMQLTVSKLEAKKRHGEPSGSCVERLTLSHVLLLRHLQPEGLRRFASTQLRLTVLSMSDLAIKAPWKRRLRLGMH